MKKPTSMFRKARPLGWGKNVKNNHATGRKHGISRATLADRELIEVVPPPASGGDYLYANCVVLAATVFGPSSRPWAEQMLPSARQLDARRFT